MSATAPPHSLPPWRSRPGRSPTPARSRVGPAGLVCQARAASPGRRSYGERGRPVGAFAQSMRHGLVAAGVLMAVATLLHPSRETTATIIASEARLVAAHL